MAEYRIKGKNEQEFWVLLNTRWKYTNGNPSGATVVVYDITERKQAEEQVKASLKEKEVLLQEIHHRVKNNLQIVSSLLSLQSGYIEDHQVLTSFQDSQDRIRSMALIHERLYRSENLAQIDFAEYIQDLATYLFRSYNATQRGITLNTRVEKILLDVDRAVPCGLILNELVSNALKNAFPDGQCGEICIKLQADGPYQARLTVSDDGIGFPADLDFRITSSLGLQLVNTLVDQVEGIIKIERDPTTVISITFATQQDKETQL
jgi:two-component sensor histidine kinase